MVISTLRIIIAALIFLHSDCKWLWNRKKKIATSIYKIGRQIKAISKVTGYIDIIHRIKPPLTSFRLCTKN